MNDVEVLPHPDIPLNTIATGINAGIASVATIANLAVRARHFSPRHKPSPPRTKLRA